MAILDPAQFEDSPYDLASLLSSCIPISPPAPHRKAPKPPCYHPKRHRARHIRMRSPAQVGLFTVEEEEQAQAQAQELAKAAMHFLPSCLDDPPISRLSPDSPRDIDADDEMAGDETHRLSWSSDISSPVSMTDSTSEDDSGLETPPLDGDISFIPYVNFSSLDVDVDVDMEMNMNLLSIGDSIASASSPSPSPFLPAANIRSRRPPPLVLECHADSRFALSHIQLQQDAGDMDWSIRSPATGVAVPKLLPALPILSPKNHQARISRSRSRSRLDSMTSGRGSASRSSLGRSVPDLQSALEDLYRSCGESLAEVSPGLGSDTTSDVEGEGEGEDFGSLVFPLPPSRSRSQTPSSSTFLLTPTTPTAPSLPALPPPARQRDPSSDSGKTRRRAAHREINLSHHYALQALSQAPSPSFPLEGRSQKPRGGSAGAESMTSVSSSSSRRSLPRRAGLPEDWLH